MPRELQRVFGVAPPATALPSVKRGAACPCLRGPSDLQAPFRGERPSYLGDQPLVLIQPGLSHGNLVVKALSQKFQLLLADELIPQGHLPLVLSLLQPAPGLVREGTGQGGLCSP